MSQLYRKSFSHTRATTKTSRKKIQLTHGKLIKCTSSSGCEIDTEFSNFPGSATREKIIAFVTDETVVVNTSYYPELGILVGNKVQVEVQRNEPARHIGASQG